MSSGLMKILVSQNILNSSSWQDINFWQQCGHLMRDRVCLFLVLQELDMMKDRFAKLLLGEDMSGGGKGVCTAVTISNAITNLYGKFSHVFIIYLH